MTCSLEIWYCQVLLLIAELLPNSTISVDSISVWYIIFFSWFVYILDKICFTRISNTVITNFQYQLLELGLKFSLRHIVSSQVCIRQQRDLILDLQCREHFHCKALCKLRRSYINVLLLFACIVSYTHTHHINLSQSDPPAL